MSTILIKLNRSIKLRKFISKISPKDINVLYYCCYCWECSEIWRSNTVKLKKKKEKEIECNQNPRICAGFSVY